MKTKYLITKIGVDTASENELFKICRSKHAIPTRGHKCRSGLRPRASRGSNAWVLREIRHREARKLFDAEVKLHETLRRLFPLHLQLVGQLVGVGFLRLVPLLVLRLTKSPAPPTNFVADGWVAILISIRRLRSAFDSFFASLYFFYLLICIF